MNKILRFFVIKLGKKSHIDTMQDNGLIHRKCYSTLFGKVIMYQELFDLMTVGILKKYATLATGTFDANADYGSEK
jgi:hypothetical protein